MPDHRKLWLWPPMMRSTPLKRLAAIRSAVYLHRYIGTRHDA